MDLGPNGVLSPVVGLTSGKSGATTPGEGQVAHGQCQAPRPRCHSEVGVGRTQRTFTTQVYLNKSEHGWTQAGARGAGVGVGAQEGLDSLCGMSQAAGGRG